MSSVIPKDRTGMVRHPFKMDCWIPGESSGHNNLCMEIPIGEMMECTIGLPNLSALTHNHLTQIKMELWNNRGGGPEGKIINSFYSGATPDQLMSSKEVQDHTDDLILYLGDAKKASDYIDRELEAYAQRVKESLAERLVEHPYEMPAPKATMDVYNEISLDWKTQIYNNVVKRFGGQPAMYLQGINKDTNLPEQAVVEFADVVIKEHDGDPRLAADVLKTCLTEHITMMSATMMNHALKEKGLMGQLTKVTDNMIEQVNTKAAANEELIKLIEGASGEKGPPGALPNLEPRKPKRKKPKRKSQHIPNMKSATVKRALGASILHMLGTVQRDTQDAHKRALLKEIPAADLIEMASGEKIPDYQANLINSWQAKADPEAPIVKRMTQVPVEVTFIGEGVRDLRITSGDESWLQHYERFTEDAADEIGTSITYVTERIGGDEFYEGLKACILGVLPQQLPEWQEQFDKEKVEYLIGRLVTGYVAGYTQSFIQKEHTDRQATEVVQAADLG